MKGQCVVLVALGCCWQGVAWADEVDELILSLKPSPVNYAAWAGNLLKAADGLPAGSAARIRLYEKAYEQGIRHAEGYATAAKAAEALVGIRPDERAVWLGKRLDAYRRDWQAAPRTSRRDAARTYVRRLIATVDQMLQMGELAGALELCREGSRLARFYAPWRKEEMALRLKDLIERRDFQYDLQRSLQLLRSKPDNVAIRERVIRMYVLDGDDCAEAAKLLTADINEKLRTYVPLAAKDLADVPAAACTELGDWYSAMAEDAAAGARQTAFAKAAVYYRRAAKEQADPLKVALAKSKLAKVSAWRPPLPAELKRGLVLHYDFDAEAGSKQVADITGRGNHGRYEGARRVEQGRTGGGCRLEAKGHVAAPSTKQLGVGGALTVCLWVRLGGSGPKWGEIVTNRDDGIESGGDFVWAMSREKMLYLYWSGDDADERSDGAPRPSSETWHHLALVVDSGTDSVVQYVNGAPAAEDRQFAKDLTSRAKRSVHIGSYGDSSIAGTVDDVMIYTRPLSGYEVALICRLQGGGS